MWYPYTLIGNRYYPLLEIELIFPSKPSFTTKALVDSGADTSLFAIEIADWLGISVRQHPLKQNRGAGGILFDVWEFPIQAKFQGRKFQLETSWCSMYNPKTKEQESFNLLGRDDFFTNFEVTFNPRKRGMKIILVEP